MKDFTIRPARPDEAGLVLDFIRKLAVYEKCADDVVADEATLNQSLFVERSAEVVFGEEEGTVVGFALFSTISPPSSDGRECTWRTCSSSRRNEARSRDTNYLRLDFLS